MRTVLTTGLCLALLGVLHADGQERLREREPTTRIRRGSHLIGSQVRIRGGAALGKVTDFVINEEGCIDYLVVRYEEELVPIPWGVIRYEGNERIVTVTAEVTPERLKSVYFREGRWPDFASEHWMRSARSVWGERALRRHGAGTQAGDRDRPPVKDDVRRKDLPPAKDRRIERELPPAKDRQTDRERPPAKDRRTDKERPPAPPDRRPPDRP